MVIMCCQSPHLHHKDTTTEHESLNCGREIFLKSLAKMPHESPAPKNCESLLIDDWIFFVEGGTFLARAAILCVAFILIHFNKRIYCILSLSTS